jgi:hypothetical protein
MKRLTHWTVTAAVAAAFGSASAWATVQIGATDSHIDQVVQPSIDKSAREQSDDTSDLVKALANVLSTRLDAIDQEQEALRDQEYVLGTNYECFGAVGTVSVVTVEIYGSGTEEICVVKK